MIRIFIFLLIVLLLGFGFAWFADRPGDVMLEWQGNQYETSLMVVLVAVVALIAAVMVIWWLGRTILDSPKIMQRFFKARRKDRGYQALSKGLIAANSGDTSSARRFAKESGKLLGQEPLVELLEAQSSLLEGNREEARSKFEAMLEKEDTRLVALRGLYLEAERQGAADAARHYAEEAHKASPSLAWAANAKLRYASKDGDWETAIATLEASKSAGLLSKDEAKRKRAVLLTAQAMSVEPADPVKAAKLAREAHRLAPDLVPAAIIGAKALARNNDIGRASGMLEAVWKKEPHPEIAQAYIHLRLGDAASDRLKRAKKLAAMKANHPEGNYIVAEAAIDAEDWKLARETMLPILTTAPTQRACLLMADIEEGQSGDQGRMREWLARAVRAPKDAAWTADGYVSEKWLPMSPVTGAIDAFEWKVPVEQLGAPDNPVLDSEGLEDLIREPQPAPPVLTESEGDQEASEPEKADDTNGKVLAGTAAGAAHAGGPVGDDKPDKAAVELSSEKAPETDTSDKEKAESVAAKSEEDPKAAATVIEAEAIDTSSDNADTAVDNPTPTKEEDDQSGEGVEIVDDPNEGFPLKRRPDDPGIRQEDINGKPKRFGLF